MKVKNAEQCVLESMREKHLDQVLAIESRCFSYPWPRESFFLDLSSPDACCLVALVDQTVVGYIIGWFVLDELHVLNIAIHPEYRRRGIGQKLLRHLLTMAVKQGCRHSTLELRASNIAAQKLYEKHGFRPVALRRNYYRSPAEDAVLMLLDIDAPSQQDFPGLEVPDGVVSKSQTRP